MLFKVLIVSACATLWVEAVDRYPLKVHHQPRFDVKQEDDTVPSSRLFDGSLIVTVNVYDNNGSPQPFNVILDTMADSFWIVGQTCKSTFCTKKKQKLPMSNSGTEVTTSHSLVEGVKETYSVEIAGTNLMFSTEVIAATKISYELADKLDSNVDGVVGLKSDLLKQILKPDGIASILASGKDAALYLGIPPELIQNKLTNRLRYIYSRSQSQWKIDINYVSNSIGEWKTWCTLGCAAVLDSTFNGISGPASDINSLNAYIGANERGEVNCDQVNKLMPIVFHIGVERYKIDPMNYILEHNDPFKTKCKSAFIVERTYNNQWRLGLPLFRQYLTVFDFNENGIAFLELVKNIVPRYIQ